MHKKLQLIEVISICWDFAAGNSSFGDEKCWFRHSHLKSSEVKCKICEDKFATKSDYQKHRKQKHPGLVAKCREIITENKLGQRQCQTPMSSAF